MPGEVLLSGIGSEAVSEEFVQRALDVADLNALRVALYQATGDESLANMRLRRMDAGGGSLILIKVVEEDEPQLKRVALEYLLSSPREVEARPNDDEIRHLMETLTGDTLSDDDFAYRRDIVAFDEFPRAAWWTGAMPRIPDGFRVVIVGAGFNGVAVAVQFERLGIPYVIFERRSDLGGTWDINSYPGVRVDTTNFIYQFSFEKNYPWAEYYSPAKDVQEYLRHVAKKHGVYEHIQFDHDVVQGDFDAQAGVWRLEVAGPGVRAAVEANVVVAASGLFSTPKKLELLDNFRGQIVHSAEWTGTEEVDGRTVAVIGNGSTGVQLLSSVASRASRVHVFQRTPQWIAPRERYGRPIEPETRWLLDTMPFYANWYVYSMLEMALATQLVQEFDPEWQSTGGIVSERNDQFRASLVKYIESKVGDRPDLIEKLVPAYAPMARRLVLDAGWYESLLHDHVELVTDAIAEVRERSIVTTDGKDRPIDLIIAATGFDLSKYAFPAVYRGAAGRTLEETWERIGGGPRAYLGTAVPDFPNFFMLYGPNSQPRSGSIISWFEIWAHYVAQAVITLIEGGFQSMAVRDEPFADYNARLDAESQKMVWMDEATAARNYRINQFGRQQIGSPFRVVDYFRLMNNFNSGDYDFR